MKLIRAFAFVAAAAAVSALPADEVAEGEETASAEAQSAEAGAEATGEAGEAAPKAKVSDKHFYVLPQCAQVTGRAEVRLPGKTDWESLVEGRHYALGATYRTVGAGSKLVLALGRSCTVTVADGASFGTRLQPLEVKGRTVVLDSGRIAVNAPRNLPVGMLTVAAPGFTAKDVAGESDFDYVRQGDGDEATVSCTTGSLAIEGRHFRILALRPSDALRIRTSHDLLFTGLYCTGGKFAVKLEQGLWESRDFETGKSRIDEKFLDWQMAPKRTVRIHRAVPKVGERMSVTIMTFLENGKLKNRCAFTEKTHALTTGELGPLTKKEKAELAKKAQKAQEEAEKAGGEGGDANAEGGEGAAEGGEAASEE